VALLCAAPAHASTTFYVNSTADQVDAMPGDGSCLTATHTCTLRAAIQEANTLGGGRIKLAPGTYKLTLRHPSEDNSAKGDLDLKHKIRIVGSGAAKTVITAKKSWNDRIFHLLAGAVTLSKMTIRHGHLDNASGGGIEVEAGASLKLVRSVVTANSASEFLGGGGGILNRGSTNISLSSVSQNVGGPYGGGILNFGTLTLFESTLDGNFAQSDGGGILNYSGATLTVINSTVSNNSSDLNGGGFENDATLILLNSTVSGNRAKAFGGGIANFGTADLNSVTLAYNEADSNADAAGTGGGISNNSGSTVNFENTIIANNFFGTQFGTSPDCNGTLNSEDYNLIRSLTGCTIAGTTTHNHTGIDPQLASLANNGGFTQTHALLVTSPAIDAGNPAGCADKDGHVLLSDQRDLPRARDGDGNASVICDMGAFEVQ
jgi:CSLREA domain-containing protein